jgi:Kelch motif
MADMTWQKKQTHNTPPSRYLHASAFAASQLFVYGGINSTGISNDLYVLNTHDWTWRQVVIQDSLPLYP